MLHGFFKYLGTLRRVRVGACLGGNTRPTFRPPRNLLPQRDLARSFPRCSMWHVDPGVVVAVVAPARAHRGSGATVVASASLTSARQRSARSASRVPRDLARLAAAVPFAENAAQGGGAMGREGSCACDMKVLLEFLDPLDGVFDICRGPLTLTSFALGPS